MHRVYYKVYRLKIIDRISGYQQNKTNPPIKSIYKKSIFIQSKMILKSEKEAIRMFYLATMTGKQLILNILNYINTANLIR